MKKFVIVLPLLILLVGCKQETYKIKSGKHNSGIHFAPHTTNGLLFSAKFDDSAIYQTQNPTNQADINKLYGFSDCMSKHQENSARIGWRWYNNELQILGYTYADGNRHHKLITSAPLNEYFEASIIISGYEYQFKVNNETVYLPRGCNKEVGVAYRLFPYFGGDETAPHDIKIKIVNSGKKIKFKRSFDN